MRENENIQLEDNYKDYIRRLNDYYKDKNSDSKCKNEKINKLKGSYLALMITIPTIMLGLFMIIGGLLVLLSYCNII